MRIEDWGLVEYGPSTQKQLDYVDAVAAGGEECVVFCSHPPVVTLGRGSVPADLKGWTGDVFEASRGGRATYHGPNQLVIYPILDLKRPHAGFASRDVHAYLRWLEQAVIGGLRELGLKEAEARTTQMGELSLTGVWVGARKIASIGIAVRKWVTYHGAAVNIHDDPQAFKGLNPCGFSADIMTSVERELGGPIAPSLARSAFRKAFAI